MNTQVFLCNKCSETVKMNYCAHCNYKTKRNFNMKRHIGIKHAPILDQDKDVGQDIAGGRVNTPFTELNELHVKDEVKDPKLLEDSITRKCEENTINVDELSKMVESMSLK